MLLAVTFARAAFSYWLTVFPRVAAHIIRWRRLARRIPDPELRRLALAALAKRANIEGAAAFAAFAPRARRTQVTLALSAFQAAYNLLDILGEQPSADPVADGRRLHEALLYALTPAPGGGRGSDTSPEDDPNATPRDWYEHHPLREDGGYLQALLEDCRGALGGLPSYDRLAPAAHAAAARIVAFQSLNLSEAQGDHAALEHWARAATPAGTGLQWWETAAAAGSSLCVHVLVARAASDGLGEAEISALSDAYFPWIGALHSLLDNLVDKHEDAAARHRSFVAYYPSQEVAAERLRWLAERAMTVARALPAGARHETIVAAMIGNYASAPEARTGGARVLAGGVLGTVGPLATPTMLVFRLRRLLGALAGLVTGTLTRLASASPMRS